MVQSEYTLKQVAEACDVHPRTIVRWIKERKVKIVEKKTPRTNQWRFSEKDLAKLLKYARQ